MISCNEFILVYNELFRELHDRHGPAAVQALWRFISETYCTTLDQAVRDDGLRGMHRYWTHTLGEEGGRYHLTLRDDEFIIDMHACPSVAKLRHTHVAPYADYCGHCPALYQPILERYGFDVEFSIIDPRRGACRLHVRDPRRQPQPAPGPADARPGGA